MSNAHKRKSVLQVSREDNLLVALRDLEKGEQVEWEDEVLTVAEMIPAKHKLATCQLAAGDPSYMYGVLVGEATKPIGPGQKINTDNLVHRSADYQQTNPTGSGRHTYRKVEQTNVRWILPARRFSRYGQLLVGPAYGLLRKW